MNIIKQLQDEIAERVAKIEQIRNECSHPPSTLTKIARSDTGNWCKADDSYWYECECGLCGKRWMEDQ